MQGQPFCVSKITYLFNLNILQIVLFSMKAIVAKGNALVLDLEIAHCISALKTLRSHYLFYSHYEDSEINQARDLFCNS